MLSALEAKKNRLSIYPRDMKRLGDKCLQFWSCSVLYKITNDYLGDNYFIALERGE